MRPWSIDAREAFPSVESVAGIDDHFIEKNDHIANFIEKNRYNFVIATKGFGKSLLLLYKRKLVSNTILIPQHEPLDVPSVGILTNEVISRLYNKTAVTILWKLAISIAISKRLKFQYSNISDSLKDLLGNDLYNSVATYFNAIMTDIERREFINDLNNDYRKTLYPMLQSIRKPIYIFIDNVDECFEDYRELWYLAHHCLGLMKT